MPTISAPAESGATLLRLRMSRSGVSIALRDKVDGKRHRRGGLMVSTQARQSEGSAFKSRSGQVAYFHGVIIRLSTLGTGDVTRGLDYT